MRDYGVRSGTQRDSEVNILTEYLMGFPFLSTVVFSVSPDVPTKIFI